MTSGYFRLSVFPADRSVRQVGICPSDHRIQCRRRHHGKAHFKRQPPDIPIAEVFDRYDLAQRLHQHRRLVTVLDLVLFLVGREDDLLVIDEIAQQGAHEQRAERRIGVPQRQRHLPENPREEAHQHRSSGYHHPGDPAVHPSLQRYDLVDRGSIPVEQRLVQRAGDRRADSQLREVQKLQQVGRRGVQSQHLRAQMVEENLARKELQNQVHEIEPERHSTVFQAFAVRDSAAIDNRRIKCKFRKPYDRLPYILS